MVSSSGTASYSIRAVDRVCDLLDHLRGAERPLTLAEVSDAVDLPRSSVLRYLSALEARDYVTRNAASEYTLGMAFRPDPGRYVEALREVAQPHLLVLRNHFGETINFGILDGHQVLHVEVMESRHRVRLAASQGERAPVHCTAVGKATLMLLSDRRIREIVDVAGMPIITPATLATPDSLVEDIHRSIARGYALDDCENQPDGRCVGVPLRGISVPAAVSVSAPASRVSLSDCPRIAAELTALLDDFAAEAAAIDVQTI